MSIGGSKGGSSSKASEQAQTTTQLDPRLADSLYGNYGRAVKLADAPYQPYSGERVAAMGETGDLAKRMTLQAASGQPGAQSLQAGIGAAMGAAGYQPTQGGAAQATASPTLAASMRRGDVGNVQASTAAQGMGAYTSPYETQVIDQLSKDVERQRLMAIGVDSDAANDAGAGASASNNSRVALMNAETNRGAFDSFARQAGALRDANYGRAVDAAGADANRSVSAQSTNQGADLAVTGQNSSQLQQAYGATAAAQNAVSSQNATLRDAMTGRNMDAELAAAGIKLNSAQLLALLGGQEREQALGDAQAVSAVGDYERQLEQARLDAQYGDYVEQRDRPLTLQQILNQSLGLVPAYGTTNSSGTSKSKGTSYGFGFTAPVGGG